MVASLLVFCTIFFGAALDFSVNLPAKVSVEIPETEAYEGHPIPVTISIIREKDQKVDESSFKLDDKPLKVEFIGNETPASARLFPPNDPHAIVVSKYRYVLPAKTKGLYLFDEVTVNVAGLDVRSTPQSYEVRAPTSSKDLRLEAEVKETGKFYPGMKLTFEYRIFFSKPTELVQEDLPLLSATGFRNIGGPKITTGLVEKETCQTIDQVVVAKQEGNFEVPASQIQGYVFKEDPTGKKIPLEPRLVAQAPPIKIEILPFPSEGRPATFTGALGLFTYKVALLTNKAVAVGEKMQLEILVSGRGDLDTVSLPDFSSEPGFLDAFRITDILPPGRITDNSKRFVVDIWPVSSGIKEIPSIQFSSFDPLLGRYFSTTTPPIPIRVQNPVQNPVKEQQKASQKQTSPKETTQQEAQKPKAVKESVSVLPVEIEGNVSLNAQNIQAASLSFTWLLIILGILILLYIVQLILYYYLKEEGEKSSTSRELFLKALKVRTQLNLCIPLIQKALLLRLFEVGDTPTLVQNPEDLAKDGLQGEIRKFLCSIDEKRFSSLGGDLEAKEFIEEATHYYFRLRAILT